MGKKHILSLLLICVIFLCLFAGCFDKAEVLTQYENEAGTTAVIPEKTKPVQEPLRPTDKENKTIEDVTYNLESKKGVHITYPSFLSLAYDELNTEIFRIAMLRMELLGENDVINQDYEIVSMSDEYISILFEGSHRSSAPYPVQYVNCLNWDMKNDSLLTLSAEQKQDIADILPECITASGLLPDQKTYLQQNDAEGYLAMVKDEALYIKDDCLFIVLEVPHAVGDYAELSLEEYYPAARLLGDTAKISQKDIMDIAIENGKENSYAGYFDSPFSDDVIYAKQPVIIEDETGFEYYTFDICLNGESIAGTTLFYPESLSVQWIDENTALLMHIFLLDKTKASISPIAGEGIIGKIYDFVSFNESDGDMEGEKILLNSAVDRKNDCVYYAFSAGETSDYELYRYDLKNRYWKPLFVDADAVVGDAFFDLQCSGEKLYFTNKGNAYIMDIATNVVQKTEVLSYLSPDGRYAMVYDDKGTVLQDLTTGEALLDANINDGLWLDNEYFVYASNSRITIFSVKDKGIVRAKTVEKSSSISLSYADGKLYYTVKK